VDPAPEGLTRQRQRQRLDPVDRRLTALLLALLLGFIVAIATWSGIWPAYRDATAPSPDAVENGEWPSATLILWSLLVLALWTTLWVVFFYWTLSRRLTRAELPD